MSRTYRIYNKILKKTQQHSSGRGSEPMTRMIGIPYHPFQQFCMGSCGMCKDHRQDQRVKRKQRKTELMNMVRCEV